MKRKEREKAKEKTLEENEKLVRLFKKAVKQVLEEKEEDD